MASSRAKEGNQEAVLEDCGRNLRLVVSWLKERYGILPRGECQKIEEPCLEKTAISRGNIGPCMRTFLGSWLREDVEEGTAEMATLRNEAKQQESKSGKRELEREGERVEIKRRCLGRVSGEVF